MGLLVRAGTGSRCRSKSGDLASSLLSSGSSYVGPTTCSPPDLTGVQRYTTKQDTAFVSRMLCTIMIRDRGPASARPSLTGFDCPLAKQVLRRLSVVEGVDATRFGVNGRRDEILGSIFQMETKSQISRAPSTFQVGARHFRRKRRWSIKQGVRVTAHLKEIEQPAS